MQAKQKKCNSISGGCWIEKFFFHDRHPGEKITSFEKASLELLKGISMSYNSRLMDWKLYWTVCNKKNESFFSNFRFSFFLFFQNLTSILNNFYISVHEPNERLAMHLACPAIGQRK